MNEDFDKKLQRGYLRLALTMSVLIGLPLLFIVFLDNENELMLFKMLWMIYMIISIRISPWVLDKIEKIFK